MEPEKPGKTRRIVRRAALWAAFATGLAGVFLAVCLGVILYRPQILWPLAQKAVAAAGGTATAGDVELSIWPMLARVENLEIILPTITAKLDHGAVYPDFSAKRRGEPLIRLVEVRGLRAEIRPSPKKEEKRPAPPDISGLQKIFDISEARISDCDISLPVGKGRAAVKGLSATIAPGAKDTRTLSASALCSWQGASPTEKASGPVKISGTLNRTPLLAGKMEAPEMGVSHPRFSGKVTALADFSLDRDGLTVSSLAAKVPSADISVSEKAGWKGLPIRLAAKGVYPFRSAPSVAVKSLALGSLASLEGEAKGSKTSDLSAKAKITVSDLAHLVAGLGPLIPASARPFEPRGSFSVTATLEKGKAAVSLDPMRVSGRMTGFDVSGLSARVAAVGPLKGPFSFKGNLKAAFAPDPKAPKPAPVSGAASLTLAGKAGRDGFEISVSPASARILHKGSAMETVGLSASAKGPYGGPFEWKTGGAVRALAVRTSSGPAGASGMMRFSADGRAGGGILEAGADIDAADAVFRGLSASLSGRLTAARSGKKPLSVNGDLALSLAPAKGRGGPDDLPPVSARASVKVRTTAQKFDLSADLSGLSAAHRGLFLTGAGTLAASGPAAGPYSVKAAIDASVKPGPGAGTGKNFPNVDGKARASVIGTVTGRNFSAGIVLSELTGVMKDFSGKISGRALASGPFKGPWAVSGNLSAALDRAEPAKPANQALKAAASLAFSGAAGSERLALALSAKDFSAALPGLSARGRARMDIKGPASAKALVSGLVTATADVDRGQVKARGLTLSIPVSGTLLSPSLKGFSLVLPKGGLWLKGKAVDIGRASAGGDLAISGKNLTARNLHLESGSLGEISGHLEILDGKPSGKFSAKGLTLEKLAALAPAFTDFPVRDWALTGAVGISGDIAKNGVIRLDSALSDLSLSSPDGSVMGQSITVALDAKTSLGENPPVTLALAAKKGEFLYKTLYMDFAKLPVSAKAYGRPVGAKGIKGLDFKGGVGNLGLLKVTGDLSKAGKDLDFSGRVNLDRADLTGIWTAFIKDSLAAARPDMAGTALSGGLAMALSVTCKSGITDVSGSLSVRDMGLSQEKGANISGLVLDLPLSYRFGAEGPKQPEAMPDWGRLTVKKLTAGPVNAGPYDLSVALMQNRFWVKEDIRVPIFGSDIVLSGIRVMEPLSSGFSARLSAVLSELDMSKLPSGMALTGKIGGTLAPIVATGKKVAIGGGLSGTFFGGKLAVSGLSVADPLGMGRTIGADVNITGVDLKPFTTALGAGLILGNVDITASKVAIAQGQPVAFDLAVRSVRKKGVPQKVTLEAVNSIAVVSSGSGLTGMGVSLMTKVFEAFPYEAMGFSCTLRNDTFSVRGLVREGGVEYLVKRPLIRGINVINRNLENKISFSDMLERIQRVRGGGKGPDVRMGSE